MSFLDELRRASSSPEVSYAAFLASYNPRGNAVYAFLEGGDDLEFYPVHMRPTLPDGYQLRPISLGGKKKVLDAMADFAARFSPNPRVLFLIDKDFDDCLGLPPHGYRFIYVTSGYSVENELCTRELVHTFCVENLHLEYTDARIPLFQSRFDDAWEGFVMASWPMMAWAFATRMLGLNANLQNIIDRDFFQFNEEVLSVVRVIRDDETMFRKLEHHTGKNGPLRALEQTEVDAAASILLGRQPMQWMRGKQVKWFVLKFLNAIPSAMSKIGVKCKCITLDASNAMRTLAGRMRCPDLLQQFMAVVADELKMSLPSS